MGEPEDSAVHPGTPDGFQRLWTPHRMVYIKGENKPAGPEEHECPFCAVQSREDREGLIVHRSDRAFAVLNLIPIHREPFDLPVPACRGPHRADRGRAGRPRCIDPGRDARTGTASAPHGFNLGINQGAAAGAGIAAHLHQHVVPRWAGDANFLPVVGQTKALPQLLDQTWEVVRSSWDAYAASGDI